MLHEGTEEVFRRTTYRNKFVVLYVVRQRAKVLIQSRIYESTVSIVCLLPCAHNYVRDQTACTAFSVHKCAFYLIAERVFFAVVVWWEIFCQSICPSFTSLLICKIPRLSSLVQYIFSWPLLGVVVENLFFSPNFPPTVAPEEGDRVNGHMPASSVGEG